MLYESTYNFPIVYIGGTFDGGFLMANLLATQTFIGVWDSHVTYTVGQAVGAYDGKVYIATVSTTGNNPPTDGGAHWSLAPAYNLTGYSCSVIIPSAFTMSSPNNGVFLGGAAGTITLKATPAQTALVPTAKLLHYYVQLTDPSGNIYFPFGGTMNFIFP